MSSAFSSNKESYELVSDVDNADPNTEVARARPTCTCSRVTVCVFVLGMLCGAGVFLIIFDVLPTHAEFPSKAANGTILGCSIKADVQILIDQNSLIPDKQTKCGKSALGQLKKFEKCFKESTGLSAECSACYGHFTVCGKEHCLPECWAGQSEKCTKCVCANCRASFLACTKLPCTLIPHNEHKCNDCPGGD